MPEDVLQKAQGHREPVGEIRVLIAAGRGDVEGAQRSTVVAVGEDVDLIGGVQRRQAGGKVQRVRGGHEPVALGREQEGRRRLGVDVVQHIGHLDAHGDTVRGVDAVAQQQGGGADAAHGAQCTGQVGTGGKAQHGDLVRVDVEFFRVVMQVDERLLRLGQRIVEHLGTGAAGADGIPQHEGVVTGIQKGQRHWLGLAVGAVGIAAAWADEDGRADIQVGQGAAGLLDIAGQGGAAPSDGMGELVHSGYLRLILLILLFQRETAPADFGDAADDEKAFRVNGMDELFEASEKLYNEGESFVLDLVGFFEDEYKEKVSRLEERGIVKFHGFQEEPRPYYAAADCIVMPSYHEGMSNVNLEASATGRPVITSDIPGCKEAVEDGKTGWLCKAQNADSLYNKMKLFLGESVSRREEMGRLARKKMENEFDKALVVESTIRALKVL